MPLTSGNGSSSRLDIGAIIHSFSLNSSMSETAKVLDKIHDLDKLAEMLEEHRRSGKRIVHCHGVFDLRHRFAWPHDSTSKSSIVVQ